MDWEIVAQGLLPNSRQIYVIQYDSLTDTYCLWLVQGYDELHKNMEEFMFENETQGYSETGSYKDIMETLRNYFY